MLAVLDPYLFHFDDAARIEPLAYGVLEDLVWMRAREGAVVPAEPSYWQPLVTEFLRRFTERVRGDSRYPRLLDRLRDRVAPGVMGASPITPSSATRLTLLYPAGPSP